MKTGIERGWAYAAIALWLMTAFLIINIPQLHMHPDEELSYRSTEGDFAFVIHYQQSYQDNQAPGWFLTFSAWRWLVGDSEFTSRILGILLVMPALALIYVVGRRGFGKKSYAGVFAILLLIGNGFFFQYALDIRPYPMVMLVTAISTWALQNWLLKPTPQKAVWYGLSIAAMLYVHYLLALFLLAQAFYILFSGRLSRKVVGQGLLAVGIGIILFLPWFPTFYQQVMGLREVEGQSGTGRGIAGIGVSTFATDARSISALIDLATNGLPLLYGAIIAAGTVLLWRRSAYWLAFTWAFITPALYLLANLVFAVYAPRFVSHAMLGFGLVLGAVCAALPGQWKFIRAGFLLMIGIVAVQLFTFKSQLPDRIPYRDIFRGISAEAQPGDVVLLREAGETDGFVAWQIRHYLSPLLQAEVTTDADAAAEHRRIWFISGDLLTDDGQALFQVLEATHPVQQVLGDCNRYWCYVAQLMEAPPSDTPTSFGEILPFYGADVDSVTSDAIHLRLWWQTDQPVPADYSIGIHLLNQDGQLITQSDGPILQYGVESIQTSALEPGKIYMDVRSLTLPENILPGTYSLNLIVYQPWDGIRLTLEGGSDMLQIGRVTFP